MQCIGTQPQGLVLEDCSWSNPADNLLGHLLVLLINLKLVSCRAQLAGTAEHTTQQQE